MKLTYEAILNDPNLIERIHAQAHRERAEAMHRLVLAPLAAFLSHRLKALHAARPHFARQG
jgi:hypothetical protein